MKQFLLTFSLLSASLLATVACKNENTTPAELSARKFAFDNTAFFTISHDEGQSALRKKLLNLALAGLLKRDQEPGEAEKIKSSDVFTVNGDVYKLPPHNFSEYKNYKENSAEIIVSYNNHLDIYFVPTGISKDKAFAQLGIYPEQDSHFYWVEAAGTYLFKEKTYYLVSTTSKEMKQNDIHFNQTVKKIGNDFNEKYFSFSTNQILVLKIAADYKTRETTYVSRTGQKISKCDWEAGTCGACQYKMEVATGAFIKQSLETAELVDLDIIVNGRNYPLAELKPAKDKDGNFIVTLNLKNMVATELAAIEFHQNPQYQVLKNVSGVEYGPSCSDKNDRSTIDVTPTLKIDLELTVQGRNLPIF
ncbi:MAG: hypothetical protein WC635_13615 [Bacteriovorax sp.]|jgi:hypothetical protein